MKHDMKKRLLGKKLPLIILCLLLAVGMGVGGTLAYLIDETDAVVNTFTPAYVEGGVHETFDGATKSAVTVENKSNIPVYVRVMLAPYWVDDAGNTVGWLGGWTPDFTLGENWIEIGNYYYYKTPVAVDASTGDLLGSSITLIRDEATGYRQALDVFAECIQAEPADAVENAWGVSVSNGVIAGQGGA